MKEIKDFPGYFITEDGRVYSARRVINKKGIFTSYLDHDNPIKLTLRKNKDGYYIVTLQKNKKGHTKLVHRLVAESYIPNPDNLPQVNHIDEIKTNNKVSNLEWCTNYQNTTYSICRYKWTVENIKTNELLEIINLNEFCRNNNLDISMMRKTFSGKRKQHKGFKVITKTQFK